MRYLCFEAFEQFFSISRDRFIFAESTDQIKGEILNMVDIVKKFEAKEGIEECKKVILAATEFASKMSVIDWKKVAAELSDLDGEERRELLNLILQKIIGAVLNILAK